MVSADWIHNCSRNYVFDRFISFLYWQPYLCLDEDVSMETIKMKCLICDKTTEHQVREYKDSHDYRCLICKKIYNVPKEIKKEYQP